MFCSNLMPWGVKLCIWKHVNARRNLLHESGFSFRPVGDIKHGFGRDISRNKVESIVLMGLFNQFHRKLLGSLCALQSLHVRNKKWTNYEIESITKGQPRFFPLCEGQQVRIYYLAISLCKKWIRILCFTVKISR